MTGPELTSARKTLGMSVNQLAEALRLGNAGPKNLREMERGKREITGPVQVAVELMSEMK